MTAPDQPLQDLEFAHSNRGIHAYLMLIKSMTYGDFEAIYIQLNTSQKPKIKDTSRAVREI